KLTHQEDNAVSNFFALLGSMPHLQSLKIDQLSRRIATSDWEMLSDFLADENCRLEHLAIGGPGLNDLRASTVAKGLASNKSLQSLLIRSPCLIHSGWGVLAAAMKKQGRLKNLFLRFCKMSSKAASDIIETAPELSALESLKLRGCEILGPSDHLADVLAKGRNLRLFHMDQMDTSSEFYSRLGQALNVTTSCQQLNVPITAKDPEQVIDAFAAALDANRTLEGFTLSEGMFGLSLVAPPIDGLAARTLIKALSRCEGLRRINLTGIELSDTCVQAVLTKLVDCANLESLTIRVEGLSKGLEDGLDTLLHEGSKIQSLVIAPPLTMHGSWSRRSSYLVPGAIGRALGKRVPLHKLTIDDIVLEGAELAAFKENAEVHQGQA
ncbi:MAG: hypothetical protein KDK78_01375, partial [Chlamydiia bacterium]|nr:hypothetical protein [Chlamydiia bacterium]